MSAFILKLIAIVSMVIDHTAHVFQSEIAEVSPWLYIAMRAVGRLAFPLFAFGVAEGAIRTRSGKKYLGRMLLFAVVSQIPFSLMVGLTRPDFTFSLFGRAFGFSSKLSVMVTLFLGLVLCLSYKEKRPFPALGALAASYFLAGRPGMDYGFWGVLLVFGLFIVREKKLRLLVVLLAFALIIQSGAAVSAAKYVLGIGGVELRGVIRDLICLAATALAALPVMLYNGKRGLKTGLIAYFVYPAHIAALLIVKYLFF